MSIYYPPASFYFSVTISGETAPNEASFKEVSGIAMEMHTEEIVEGGLNDFRHRVPGTAKYSNLVLKRGLLAKDSPLAHWCIATLEGGLNNAIRTNHIMVSLLNESGEPIRKWHFANAWPVKWDVADFNSENNEFIVEKLEFAFNSVK